MQKIIGTVIVLLSLTAVVHARGKTAASGSDFDPQLTGVVNQWMTAYQKQDAAALSRLGPTGYSQLLIVGDDLLQNNLASAAAAHPLTEFRIERIATVVPGQLAVANVQEIVEDNNGREWEASLSLKNIGGRWQVAYVTHIAMETHVQGYPEGCPETVFRREEVANLDGHVVSAADTNWVRIFKVRRDTGAWGASNVEVDTEATKCLAKPELVVEDLQAVVADLSGKILAVQQLGRSDDKNGGITLYDGSKNGSAVRGGVRLETMTAGAPQVFLLSREYQGGKGTGDIVGRLSAYLWKGSGFKNVWNFDFLRKGASFAVDLQIDGANKRLVATLQRGGEAIKCPEGTVISYQWTGSTFKVADKVKGSCMSSAWPSEGSILGRHSVKLPPANTQPQDDN